MSIQKATEIIRQLAETTLQEAYAASEVEHLGTFLLGDERTYGSEFADQAEPHIIMYMPIARRPKRDGPVGVQCMVGFYDKRSIDDHKSEDVAEIQFRMEALFSRFAKNLTNYEDENYAPLPIENITYETVNKNYHFIGTGIVATFFVSFEVPC